MDRTETVLGSGSAAGFWPGRLRLGGVGIGPGVVWAPADEGAGGGGEPSPAAEAPAAEGAPPAEAAKEAAPKEGAAAEAKPPGSLLTDAADEKSGEAGKEAEAPKEPVVYEKFTVPEGVDLSGPSLDAFKELAAEHGLSQQAAQGVVDLHLQMQTAQVEAQAALVQGWADDAKADKEFGGAGFDASMGMARKALQAYGSPELAQVLNESGLGSHPEVIRAFYRIGKTLGEDGKAPPASSTAAGGQEALLRQMYPSHYKD